MSPSKVDEGHNEGESSKKKSSTSSVDAPADVNSFAFRYDVMHKTLLRCMKKYYTQRFFELTKFKTVSLTLLAASSIHYKGVL